MDNIPINTDEQETMDQSENSQLEDLSVEDAEEQNIPENVFTELEQTQSALDETKDKLLRLAADFENYKRQAQRRETETRERVTKSILVDLLPVLDNFERAVHATSATQDVQNLRTGVEFILQQFEGILRDYGVEPIQTAGQPFDPQHHEAVEEIPHTEHEPGTVIAETQRGYSYKGQVLRPSLVKVASESDK